MDPGEIVVDEKSRAQLPPTEKSGKIKKYSREYDATRFMYLVFFLTAEFPLMLFVLELKQVDTPKFFTTEFLHTFGGGLLYLVGIMGGYLYGRYQANRDKG